MNEDSEMVSCDISYKVAHALKKNDKIVYVKSTRINKFQYRSVNSSVCNPIFEVGFHNSRKKAYIYEFAGSAYSPFSAFELDAKNFFSISNHKAVIGHLFNKNLYKSKRLCAYDRKIENHINRDDILRDVKMGRTVFCDETASKLFIEQKMAEFREKILVIDGALYIRSTPKIVLRNTSDSLSYYGHEANYEEASLSGSHDMETYENTPDFKLIPTFINMGDLNKVKQYLEQRRPSSLSFNNNFYSGVNLLECDIINPSYFQNTNAEDIYRDFLNLLLIKAERFIGPNSSDLLLDITVRLREALSPGANANCTYIARDLINQLSSYDDHHTSDQSLFDALGRLSADYLKRAGQIINDLALAPPASIVTPISPLSDSNHAL